MKVRWIILALVAVLAVVNFADKSIIGLSAVHVMDDLDLSYDQWGIVGSSFYWLFSIAGIIGAAMSDRFGTAKMLGIMAVVWTLAQSMIFFVSSFPMLVVGRVMLGVGEGPFFATAISHISKWFPADKRGLPISILNVGNVAGKAITAPIIVFLILRFGWRAAFLLLALVSFMWVLAWLFFGRKKPSKTISEQTETTSKEKVTWSKIGRVLRAPTFISSTIVLFICYGLIAFSSSFMPAFYTQVKDVAETNMSYILAIGGAAGAILSVGLSILSDRIYKRTGNMRQSHVYLPAYLLMITGCLHFLLPYVDSGVTFTIISVSENAVILLLFTLLPQVVNSLMPERRGTMSGVSIGVATSAGVFGPMILGAVIDSGANIFIGYTVAIQSISIIMVLAAIAYILFAKPSSKRKHERLKINVSTG